MKRSAIAAALAVLALGVLGLTVGSDSRSAGGDSPADRTSPSGVVFRYYPGSGWHFQPLLSFAHMNDLVTAGRYAAAGRLADALLARAHRDGTALYWSY